MSAPPLTVHGTQVHFPFEPYPSQHVYIGKVIEGIGIIIFVMTGRGNKLIPQYLVVIIIVDMPMVCM